MLLILPAVFICLCSGAEGGNKLVVRTCDWPAFQTKLQFCLSQFNSSMELTDYRSQCVWPHVKGSYNVLKLCVDKGAKDHWCKGVGSFTDDFFLLVHRTYFPECGRTQDPPLTVLILMVAPLVLSTLMLPLLCVHLTVTEVS